MAIKIDRKIVDYSVRQESQQQASQTPATSAAKPAPVAQAAE